MLVNVITGGKTAYLDNGVPYVIGGKPAVMDTEDLEKRTSTLDNDIERTVATEYWLDGELVHRSVHVHLKTGLFADGIAAEL